MTVESNLTTRRSWLKKALVLGASTSLLAPAGALEQTAKPRSGIIKLSGNENPYGPSKKARNAIRSAVEGSNRYPFAEANTLIDALAAHHSLQSGQYMLGAGSSQLLEVIGHWVLHERLPLIHGSLTFDILPQFVKAHGGAVHSVPMIDLTYDLTSMVAIAKEKRGVVYLANPNNPTGHKLDYKTLKDFVHEVTKTSYLILDEAYIEYAPVNESLLAAIKDNSKLIVLRTFSKIYGLAGLRIGYLVSDEQSVTKLRKFNIWKNYGLNGLGIAAAIASLGDEAFANESRIKNDRVRARFVNELRKLDIFPIDPAANYVFFPIPENVDLVGSLLKSNIRIGQKAFEGRNYARITIGKSDEMDQLIKTLTKLL